jgi:hypothetical protein
MAAAARKIPAPDYKTKRLNIWVNKARCGCPTASGTAAQDPT